MVATRIDKRVPPDWPGHVVFEMHAPDVTLPDDVAGYLRAKLTAKLAKFGHQLTEIVVHLKDVNGTRGGVDKCCHIEVRLARHEPVNVDERDEDLRAAIDLAVERTAEAVHRQVERVRSKRLHQGRKIVRRVKVASS
jgi:ribosome-associated translation inhibitor RaiA